MAEGLVTCPVNGKIKRLPIIFESNNRTFTISPDRIEAQTVSTMSPVLRDLLEVACAVFAADSEFSRGGSVRNNMGQSWSRDLSFTLPVRCLETWRRPEVRDALTDAVEFLTEDRVMFHFVQKDDDVRSIEFLPFEPAGNPFAATEVILFSGGLDSFAGALEALSKGNGNIVLVTHRSAQKAIPRQEKLGEYLKKRFSGRVLHIQIHAIRKGHEGRESTQRSRSLLFAALGYAVARMLGASRVSFYENGVVSQNLPISPQVIGTMATRTTHPLSLLLLERLLHALDDAAIPIRNGFEWLTKKEVVEKIAERGAPEQITRAVSCTRLRDQDTLKTHCGECSQCLDRRFAILAAGLADHDDDIHYHTDVLHGPRDTDLSRTMAIDWSRHAWRMSDLALEEFYHTFTSELSRVIDGHPELSLADVVRRSHAMQQRQSEVVRQVFRADAAGILDPAVPTTSLLKMFGAERLAAEDIVATTARASRTEPETSLARTENRAFDLNRLEVAFYHAGSRPAVEVAHLGTVKGAPASVPHGLKRQFEHDRDAGLDPKDFRYTPPGMLTLANSPSKNSVHQNVRRCRTEFELFYGLMMGEPLPKDFLIQTHGRDGYRLDPTMRIIGLHQVPSIDHNAGPENPMPTASAQQDGLSAPRR